MESNNERLNTGGKHDCEKNFEWQDWSTSTYIQGYWVCRICGNVEYNRPGYRYDFQPKVDEEIKI